jgi:hypothetical protein
MRAMAYIRFTNRALASTVVALALIGNPAVASATSRPHDDKVERYVQSMSAKLERDERDALSRIASLDRKLLALRAYVRAGKNLGSRWSWSDQEIRAFEASAEFKSLLADIEAITNEFERRNPGYTLYANTQVRSLDTQIERWNSNPRVGTTAGALFEAVRKALGNSPREPNDAALARFEQLLKEIRPAPSSPLAAPGLSMHGQSRAIDFQIMKDGRIVAATEVGAVAREWDDAGWTRKLKQAVLAGSPRFKGPLEAPDEPWHYEYQAQEKAAD